jgi:hypothetical protein
MERQWLEPETAGELSGQLGVCGEDWEEPGGGEVSGRDHTGLHSE